MDESRTTRRFCCAILLCLLMTTIPSVGAQGPRFDLTTPEEITIGTRYGQHQIFGVSIAPAYGFEGTVHIDFSNLPQGISIGPSLGGPGLDLHVSTNALSGADYVMSAGFGAVLGNYTMTTTATSGAIVSTRNTVIHVVQEAECNPIQFPQDCPQTTSSESTTHTTRGPIIPDGGWIILIAMFALSGLLFALVIAIIIMAVKKVRPSPRICKHCGAVNPKYAETYCVQCGEPFNKRRT